MYCIYDEKSTNTKLKSMRWVSFTIAPKIEVCRTRFHHLDILKTTWSSTNRYTTNPINHIVIDGSHVSMVLNMYTIKSRNIDSDYYLFASEVRVHIR